MRYEKGNRVKGRKVWGRSDRLSLFFVYGICVYLNRRRVHSVIRGRQAEGIVP